MQGDVSVRPLLWGGFAIAAAVAVVIASVFLLLSLWDEPPDSSRVRMPYTLLRPGPLLQSEPQPDLARYRADKQRLVDSAAWVDARRGIARIAVADAMALLAASAASAPRRVGGEP
jgi:hypothetical protein